jgi:peroxiredoxin Q/BCP
MGNLKIGSKAPDFESFDDNGNKVRLSDFLGKYIVLYFYPKDNTPGCTKEACNFRDSIEDIYKLGATVIGISVDSVNSHKNFKQKYNLNFPLISDSTREISSKYGVLNLTGTSKRTTFLISPDGEILYIWDSVKVDDHHHEVIQKLQEILNSK